MGVTSIGPDTVQNIFDNIFCIMLVFDDRGVITYINESGRQQLGYNKGEVNIREILPALFTDDIDIAEFVVNAADKVIYATAYRKNCTCFNADIKSLRLSTEDGASYYNVISMLNTQYELQARQEIERVESSMKEAMKARNEFVANITHELRTPVNGIKGHIKNLYNSETDSEKKKTLDIVFKCCENMEKIINNFLDFSKIEAGKFEINESEFDFRACMNHVLDTNMVTANEKGLRLSAYVADDIPEIIVGDELRIVQILNNLVSNALKFTSIGYVAIEVYKTRLKHGRMELTFFVIDTGIGITLEEKEKIFESFSQADASITRRYGGTGLGLYVTKQLVGLMRGDIRLDSEKGKGSTFSFNIEVGVTDAETSNQQENAQLASEFIRGAMRFPESESMDFVYVYGSRENLKEINNNIEKLVLCIEMGNWEKAEFFSDNIKTLLREADKAVKSVVLRLRMAVKREDYDESIDILQELKDTIKNNGEIYENKGNA